MKSRINYKRGRLSVFIDNNGADRYHGLLEITVNGKNLYKKVTSTTKIGIGIFFDHLPMMEYENVVTVDCHNGYKATETIILPEMKLISKLENSLFVYNPVDNREVKDIGIKIHYWNSEPNIHEVESIRPGTGIEIKILNKNKITEVSINGKQVIKNY